MEIDLHRHHKIIKPRKLQPQNGPKHAAWDLGRSSDFFFVLS